MSHATDQTPTLATFLEQLWETGRVSVLDLGARAVSPANREESWLQLRWYAGEERSALPGSAPDVSRPSAEWALLRFYRACSFLVHRKLSAEEMRSALDEPAPEAPSPSVCYSVDLTFRFLPDLHRLARGVSPNDPLVEALGRWGREWPLSSVGMESGTSQESPPENAESGELPPAGEALPVHPRKAIPCDLGPFWDDPCLRRLYVDRVIQRGDLGRLADPRVVEGVREALGGFPQLAPRFAEALDSSVMRSRLQLKDSK